MKRLRNIAALAGLAVILLAFFLARYPIRDFRLPMGPDAPVYMWWANLSRIDGLSVAGWRPGTPALTLLLGGALGRGQLEIVAGLGGALAASVGLATVALVRRGSHLSVAWSLLGGLLAGTWAVHLAGGYFGNLVFALTFLAAIALLGRPGGRTTLASALLIGAGGLAHPLFLVVGIVVMLLGLWLTHDPGARARLWIAACGGGALTGVGLLAMFIGPRPLVADTSADAFMRRAGFGAELRSAYLERFRHHWARYVPWLSLPSAWAGRREADEPVKPILNAWVVVALLGLGASLLVPLIPGVRLIAFAFAIPILATFGLGRMAGAVRPRWVAFALVVLVAFVMVVAAGLTWSRERPYADVVMLDRIQTAAARLADTPAGTPLIFVIDENAADDLLPFRATNTGNLLRAHLPAERIGDVHVFVGDASDLMAGRPTITQAPFHDALSRRTLADLASIEPSDARVFILTSRDTQEQVPGTASLLTDDATYADVDVPSPRSLVATGVLIFLLLLLVGFGWSHAAVDDPADAFALAPAFGAGVLIMAGIVADRLGIRLSDGIGTTATAVAALAGYAAWIAARTRPARDDLGDSET